MSNHKPMRFISIKSCSVSGSEFDGKAFEPTPRRLKALRREIAIVFQSYNLFPHLCVERNITLGPTAAKGIKLAAARELARKVLRMVDLEDKIAAYPQQLSGGQQQRVAIARALAMEPRLVLFDEITAALDPELIGEVVRVLDRLARDGMTMVLVTHEMGFARRSADTIVFMHQGRIWERVPPQSCSAPPRPPNSPLSSPGDAGRAAVKLLANLVQREALVLTYNDAIMLIGCLFVVALFMMPLVRRPRATPVSPGH